MFGWILFCIVVSANAGTGDRKLNRVKRIMGGSPAQLPPGDDPTVYLQFAGRAAAIKGVLDEPHYVFRGIRYAYNPVGKDRFQRPRQYFLQGEVDATVYPPPCLQKIPNDAKIIGSEDCLFLNIFTPDLPDGTEGLPVIFWIHGGGFRYGSASQYGVRNLVGRRLVLVTVQYRLGTLGFLSTGSPELPGNAALWDMALAVQWVRNYIGFFGGNPHNIVVMGQGTGGSSALMMALSNIAKGSVNAVISMSGTAISHWALENSPAVTAKEISDYHGCPTSSILIMLKCLQNLPADSIVEGDSQLEKTRLRNRGFVSGLNGLLGSAPNAEGRYDGRSLPPAVQSKPIDDMTEGNIPDIPILTGVTKDETKKVVHGKFRNEVVEKLKTVPNFLDQVLIKNLQTFTEIGKTGNSSTGIGGLFNLLDPLQFRNYLHVAKNNVMEGLHRISEITNDALFNLPAFLTADMWSRKNVRAYLYRFDHAGNARKGRHFLNGFSLVANETEELAEAVGHGDDLGYIFEARNLDGSPLPEPQNLTEDDIQVQETILQLIADFARTGKVMIDNREAPQFNSKSNNFIQISKSAKQSNDFRFCEMALWAGLVDRLKSKTCSFLNVLDGSVKHVENLFFDTMGPGGGQVVEGVQESVGKLNPLNVLKLGPQRNKNAGKSSSPLGFLG